ncbi:MAG: type VI secretion system membrane subunit TssM [Thalassobaculaceae bacterium]|nr:type VI secretion system membrane subunit TssM [Thalassobaculaceae bacterium]
MRILLSILSFLGSRVFLTFIGVIALSLLVWYLGPRLKFGTAAPLAGDAARIAVIVAIWLIWLLSEAFRRWRLRWLNRRMIESLAESRTLTTLTDNRNEEESDLIHQRFEQALRVLQSRTVSGRSGGRYLYDLPWYVLIGPPGSGKTTVLANSGLEFPLADELGVEMIEGFGGTRTCDWWFTEEAVFIDTAGRYTTQNINPEADRAAWQSFLETLKEHRARRPVNGIIVSVGLDSLLAGDADGVDPADAIKARIQELMGMFRTRLPIYVLINKCDLISGFREFFDDLGTDDREQIFGITLGSERTGTSARALQEFSEEYDKLVQRLSNRLVTRLDEERKSDDRRTLFTFPQQMAGLKRPLDRFLSDVFRPSRYSTQPLLRGVYFTSGMQEGVPVDGLMAAHAGAYNLSPSLSAPQESGEYSYFINRIMRDVVFPEQHLAGTDRQLERKLAAFHLAAYCVLGLITSGLIMGWWYSVNRSDPTLEILTQQLDAFEAKRAIYDQNPNIQTAIETIDQLEPGQAHDSIPEVIQATIQNFGLLAQVHIEPLMNRAFREASDDILVPAMSREIGNNLAIAVHRNNDPAEIRRLLTLYLGLGDPTLFNRTALENWAAQTTKQLYPLEPQKQTLTNQAFGFALDSWPGAQTLNQSLVEQARGALFSIPPASQVYSQLKGVAIQSGVPPQSLQNMLGIRDSQLFVYRRAQGERAPTIPNLYTADGFYNLFIKRTPPLISAAAEDDPLSGRAGSQTEADTKKVIDQVTKEYTIDYIANWNAFLDGIHLRALRNVQDANNVLETLSGNNSPLVTLVNAVANNTILPLSRASDPSQLPTQASSSAGSGGFLGSLTGSVPAGAAQQAVSGAANASASAQNTAAQSALSQLGPFSRWPGAAVAEPFRSLQELVVSRNNSQPGITHVQQTIVNLYSAVNLVSTAPDVGKAAFDEVKSRIDNPRNSPITAVSTAAVSQPSPVQEIMSDLATETWSVLLAEAQGYLDAQWQQSVAPECQRAIFQRYPAYRDAKNETAITDFAKFFAPTGTMATFFSTYLAPFVDTSSTPWKTRQVDGKGLNISAQTLQAFADAKVIADAFFPNNAPTPTVSFTLRPSFLDSNAARIAIDSTGPIFTYRHEPPRDLQLSWPPSGGTDKVSVTITDLKGASTSYTSNGPWAWFRLFDKFGLKSTGLDDKYELPITLKSLQARFEVSASSVVNPFDLPALSGFRCGGDL